jgi:hypothetical protein
MIMMVMIIIIIIIIMMMCSGYGERSGSTRDVNVKADD